ncbi:hypothetical protein EDB19DRAFT_2029478 [Suillus lakei]|nr:hypothetical protein EDB19DRAFT_2029478 [Suillus lakei]
MQNFSTVMAPPRDSRTTYQQDLLGRIDYRPAKPIKAYEKWTITSIDTVIKPIVTTIRASPDLAEFRQSLQDSTDEKHLYSPLQAIFRTIEGAAAGVTGYKRTQFRQLVSMSDHVPDAENMSFPHNKPDFVLAEVPPTSDPLTPAIDVGSDGVKWRQISGFIEVKSQVRDGPNVIKSTSVKPIVSQAANYARLIMAARPFQLYVLCVFIYGHKFSLGWYDRRGVIISEDYDILNDLDILVNVILQLTTHMTTYQLGHDRSARLLEGHSYYQLEYPSFLVSMGAAGDTRLWKTKGPPIWSSLSLLGRGTATWRAVVPSNKPEKDEVIVILKTLWRSQTRESESNIYGRIKLPLPGVAEFSLGDDIRIPLTKETHACVTIGNLRSLILNDDAGVLDDPVLHRHQGLVEQGILHRDMSPGNIFIGGPGCAEGWEGFVADLEFASVAQPETETVISLHPLSPSVGQLNTRGVFLEETVPSSSKAPGAEITGTALFMAEELLSLMLLPDKKKIQPAQIKREVHHDLESFILVIFYSVMKRGLERRLWHDKPDNESQIQQLYRTLFGGHTIRLIRQGRSCFLDESDPPVYLLDALDAPTHGLLYGCWRLLKMQRPSNFPINERRAVIDRGMQWTSGSEERKMITYAQLYKVYDLAMPAFWS